MYNVSFHYKESQAGHFYVAFIIHLDIQPLDWTMWSTTRENTWRFLSYHLLDRSRTFSQRSFLQSTWSVLKLELQQMDKTCTHSNNWGRNGFLKLVDRFDYCSNHSMDRVCCIDETVMLIEDVDCCHWSSWLALTSKWRAVMGGAKSRVNSVRLWLMQGIMNDECCWIVGCPDVCVLVNCCECAGARDQCICSELRLATGAKSTPECCLIRILGRTQWSLAIVSSEVNRYIHVHLLPKSCVIWNLPKTMISKQPQDYAFHPNMQHDPNPMWVRPSEQIQWLRIYE